jgi:hypothetical protein
MSESELEKLRSKANCYTYLITKIRRMIFEEGFYSNWKETAEAVIRMLENQKRMVEFAIYSREKGQNEA